MFKTTKYTKAGFEFRKITTDYYQLVIIDQGASVYQLKVLNKDKVWQNIVLTYKELNSYKQNKLYLGANIGRNANRIENGFFTIKGKSFTVDKNENNQNNLHGGHNGLHLKKFTSSLNKNRNYWTLNYETLLTAKEDGFPGNLKIKISYQCFNKKIKIKYWAKTDKDTICNLTNHTYFNLNGSNQNIKSMKIQGRALGKFYLNENKIINNFSQKKEELFDKEISLNKLINNQDKQTKFNHGLDNPFLIKGPIVISSANNDLKLEISSSNNTLFIYTHGYETSEKILNHNESKYLGLALEFQELLINKQIEKTKLFLGENEIYNKEILWKILSPLESSW